MHSELRQDLVTGDWILIAPGRARRPLDFLDSKKPRVILPKTNCPFEDLRKSGGEVPSLYYAGKKDWRVQIVPNKYPAVMPSDKLSTWLRNGPYVKLPGTGRHDIVITRDHYKNCAELSFADARLVFRAFRERYQMFVKDSDYLAYASIFHNWGPSAGASIFHPHYQIIALPIVPPDVAHSLAGSKSYFDKNKKCVHCQILRQETKDKKRILHENDCAIAYAPYVSRTPFELRIFPKRHSPYFEDAPKCEVDCVVRTLQAILRILKKRLKDPDYNFFIHTAPILEKKYYGHYHWHIEIRPKISTPAGFELSTGIDINVVDPDVAAKILKSR